MTRTSFPGGSYCDALPSGEYCVLVYGSHIETHLGRVALPPNENGPLFLRCSNVGGFRFAGQAHESNGGYEWREGAAGWRAFPPPVCGVSPVIYDHAGVLHVSDCSIGSQGYRYVTASNRVVSGDETYGSAVGLSEWSAYAELLIGQGHDGGGCLVFDGKHLRVLEPGDCRFIRVQGDGERVAVSFVKPDGAVIMQATLAELRALPLVNAPAPDPVPVPNPQPKPEPMPMPFTPLMPNRLDVVEAVKAAHPDEWAAREDLRFVKRLAWALYQIDPRFGLLGKRMTDTLAADSVTFLNPTVEPDKPSELSCEAADIIAGSHTSNPQPGWNPITKPIREGGAGAKWIKPQPIAGTIPPDPGTPPKEPPPPAPVVNLQPVLDAVSALKQEIAAERAALLALAQSIETLRTTPPPAPVVVFPKYKNRFIGISEPQP